MSVSILFQSLDSTLLLTKTHATVGSSLMLCKHMFIGNKAMDSCSLITWLSTVYCIFLFSEKVCQTPSLHSIQSPKFTSALKGATRQLLTQRVVPLRCACAFCVSSHRLISLQNTFLITFLPICFVSGLLTILLHFKP